MALPAKSRFLTAEAVRNDIALFLTILIFQLRHKQKQCHSEAKRSAKAIRVVARNLLFACAAGELCTSKQPPLCDVCHCVNETQSLQTSDVAGTAVLRLHAGEQEPGALCRGDRGSDVTRAATQGWKRRSFLQRGIALTGWCGFRASNMSGMRLRGRQRSKPGGGRRKSL